MVQDISESGALNSIQESIMETSLPQAEQKEVPLKSVGGKITETKTYVTESNHTTHVISNSTTHDVYHSAELLANKPSSLQEIVLQDDTNKRNTPTSTPRSLSPVPKAATSEKLLTTVQNAKLSSAGISRTASASSLSSMAEATDNKKLRAVLKVRNSVMLTVGLKAGLSNYLP